METLESLRSKIESTQDLQSVVTTMKALAAASIHQYERAVESLSDYSATIERGLAVVLRKEPARSTRPRRRRPPSCGAVLIGSEQGLAGQFNEDIVRHALQKLRRMRVDHENRFILALGQQVVGRLHGAGELVHHQRRLPKTLAGVGDTVRDVLLVIEKWDVDREADQVVMFHHRPTSGSSYRPHTVLLLPLNQEWLNRLEDRPWTSRTLPMFTMDVDRLFSSLVRHHLFTAVYRALVESLASENASRLAAMQAAERNIREHLDALRAQYHHQRQSSITAELLDIVAGYQALTEGGHGAP